MLVHNLEFGAFNSFRWDITEISFSASNKVFGRSSGFNGLAAANMKILFFPVIEEFEKKCNTRRAA